MAPKITRVGQRGTLSRDRILRAALAVVDADGAGALTMRRIATELGVDPMALYRHVPNKDALLDGVVEMLWAEVPAPVRHDDWAEPLRAYAHNLRTAINAHPNAVPLVLTTRVFTRPSLAATATLLANLRDAGFEESDAAQILRSVISAALGEALSTLTYQAVTRSTPPSTADSDTWISITQALPADTPPDQVRAAYAVCACEPDADFTFVLDLILDGAQKLKRSTARSASTR